MDKIDLNPVVYSKAKTVAGITEKLRLAPEQVPNSREAFEGHVMEFVLFNHPDTRVGTLTEFSQEFPEAEEFVIHLGNAELVIEKQGKKFLPKEMR